MTSFASIGDVVDLLGREISSVEAKSIQLVLDLSTAAIKDFTRQTLERVTGDTVKLRGNTSRILVLPERPVISVSAISINGVPIGPSGYQLVQDELWWGAGPLNIANATDDLGYGWGTKSTPIEVTYTHGFDPIPDTIRGVCAYMTHRAFLQPVAISSEAIGNYQVSYGRLAEGGIELASFEQKLLTKYRRTWF